MLTSLSIITYSHHPRMGTILGIGMLTEAHKGLIALQITHQNRWWFVLVLWRQWTPSVDSFAIRTTQWKAASLLVTMMVAIWQVMLSPTYHCLQLYLSG